MAPICHGSKKRFVPLNDQGRVIGESHHRAKLTDIEVELILTMMEARDEVVRKCQDAGMNSRATQKYLTRLQLSQRCVADLFGVSRRLIRDIYDGTVRGQVPREWKPAAHAMLIS